MWTRHRGPAAGALVATALLLAGCAAGADEAPDAIAHVDVGSQGAVDGRLPPDARPDESFGPMLHWARPDMLVLTTFGSSSCPDRVQELSVREDGIQQVVLADPTAIHGACTADLAPRRLQVPVLEEALGSGELTVWVRYAGELYGQVTEFSMGDPTAVTEIHRHTPNAGG